MLRIVLEDSIKSMIIKLGGGNPGALKVCCDLFVGTATIDPDACFGEASALLALDKYEIYEERIWMLYKDVCQENLTNMIGILRAVQLGLLAISTLNKAIDNRGIGVDIEGTLELVQKKLPNFNKPNFNKPLKSMAEGVTGDGKVGS